MKNIFLLSIACTIAFAAVAQKKNVYSLVYNVANSGVITTIGKLSGGGSHNIKDFKTYGFNILHATKKKVKLETGLQYSKLNCSFTPSYYPGANLTPQPYSIQLLTVPLLARFDFWKYCYFKTGIFYEAELQHEKSNLSNQTGLGLNAGLGLHYNYRNFVFQVNPYIQTHSNVGFQRDRYQYHILESGVQLGIGVKL